MTYSLKLRSDTKQQTLSDPLPLLYHTMTLSNQLYRRDSDRCIISRYTLANQPVNLIPSDEINWVNMLLPFFIFITNLLDKFLRNNMAGTYIFNQYLTDPGIMEDVRNVITLSNELCWLVDHKFVVFYPRVRCHIQSYGDKLNVSITEREAGCVLHTLRLRTPALVPWERIQCAIRHE